MTRRDLKQILSSKFEFEKWKELLGLMFPRVDFLTKAISVDTGLAKAGGQVGTIRLDDGRSLGLFLFEVADNIIVARNRKGLRDIAIRYVDQDIIHGALVLYYSDNQPDYRLTFVSKQTVINEDGVIETKTTAPKRYTFLLGSNEPCATAANRLFELVDKKQKGSLFLTDVEEAFSVERLNKDFFNGYKDRYKKFLAYLDDDTKDNRDYVKKLLGRLVFLQFLQKKGWMGVPAINGRWENGDRNYLYNLVKHHNGNDHLLSDVLETLFFETLNEPRTDDIADPILGDNIKIPYLNGGLFDRDNIDKKDVDFPYTYFFELMEFFGMYNFTIDENDPDDAEIGVDPEMLGHIFENLLEDNKDKGAFYTPKEIVQYMSQESIAQYLKTHTDESLHLAIDELIKKRKVPEALLDKNAALKVYQLLSDVKVCDPAIGSGAFPMGILNVLYHSRLLLYGFTKPTKEFSPSTVKRDIIQNNIYGVDIEKGAIDIARLRFWLSIVVDSEKPEALPNFDYKFMQGNSLIESYHSKDLSQILNTESKKSSSRKVASNQYGMEFVEEETQKNLQIHLEQYFSIDDHKKKEDCRKLINDSVKSYIRQALCIDENDIELNRLKPSENQEFFLWHTWFKDVFDKGGFDVVIGNPPYVNVQLMTIEEKELYRKTYKSFFKRCDMFCLFLELGLLTLTTKNGIVTLIIPSVIHSNLSYQKIRDIILNSHWLHEVRYTGGNVFNAPTVDTTILVCNKDGNNNIILTKAVDFSNPKSHQVDANYFLTYNNVISIEDNQNNTIFDKLFNPLFDTIDQHYNVFQGIVTGNNNAFIFDSECDAIEKGIDLSLLHPICHGRDIEKYKVRNLDRRILYVDNNIDIEKYPTTKAWLLKYRESLGKRREAQRGVINWYGLQWPRIKTELDKIEKILVQNTRNEALKTRLVATLDKRRVYGTQGINFIISKHDSSLCFLLGVLNSKIINYLFATKFLNLAIKAEYLKQVRIPVAPPQIQTRIENLVEQILQKKENDVDTITEEKEIDQIVNQLYCLSESEIAIIDNNQ